MTSAWQILLSHLVCSECFTPDPNYDMVSYQELCQFSKLDLLPSVSHKLFHLFHLSVDFDEI